MKLQAPVRYGVLVPLIALMSACRTATPGQPSTTIMVDPAPQTQEAAADTTGQLPGLPVTQLAEPSRTGGPLISLEAVDQDLATVVRALAQTAGYGFQIAPEVKGRVTARFKNATLTEALDAVVVGNGFSYAIQGQIIQVGPARFPSRIFSLDYIALSRFGTGSTVIQRRLGLTGGVTGPGGLVPPTAAQPGVTGLPGAAFGGADVIQSVEVADLWEDIRVSLEGLIFDTVAPPTAAPAAGAFGGLRGPGAHSRVAADGRRLIINPMAGTILVTAPASKLAEVETFLKAFESSIQRQVAIEAKFVEVLLDRDSRFGINWDAVVSRGSVELIGKGRNPPGAAGLSTVELTLRADKIETVLQALEQQGEVRVLSSPRVSTLNNQRAVINVGTDEVFFTITRQPVIGPTGATIGFTTQVQPQQIAVGILLDVLPQIGPNNTITMNVRPVVTDVIRVEEVSLEDGTQVRAPVIDRRETDTVVRVRAGETIAIGGLMRTRHEVRTTGIPILKDIPLLGALFRSRQEREEQRELVIFLTPSIVAGQAASGS
ncbi:MAG: pilus (MSHA type) biogenesis protein MshL [Gemmatimonadales bacterium]|nr:MAG: pilus (MSHA type) biogenesis protein MshL [Gemmatimonadales bacterium]